MLDYRDEMVNNDFQQVFLDLWTDQQVAAYLSMRGDNRLLERLQVYHDPLLRCLGQLPYLLYIASELSLNNLLPAVHGKDNSQFLTSRSKLFKDFVDMLLDRAESTDKEGAYLFQRKTLVSALSRLASAMQETNIRGQAVAHDWATQQLAADPTALLAAGSHPDPSIRDVRDRLIDYGCSATILDTPATRDTVRFWHLTHQDYFASLAPRQDGPDQGDAGKGPALPPALDDAAIMAAARSKQPAVAVGKIFSLNDRRAPLVAAKAAIYSGQAGTCSGSDQ